MDELTPDSSSATEPAPAAAIDLAGEPPTLAASEPERVPIGEPVPWPVSEATAAAPGERLEERSKVRWRRVGREIVSGAQTLLSAAVYATLIVTFAFQVARVDGLSMAPTLGDQDRLIVNKLVYQFGDPRPGDIVMLYYPVDPDKMFVKRVIAQEGDTVRIVEGRVYVNELPLADEYVPSEFRSHDDMGPTVIQPGYYFVMGDHRNNSLDSRHWGSVPKKYIVGKVNVRWWPIQDARIF
jgi:signal peptidase I